LGAGDWAIAWSICFDFLTRGFAGARRRGFAGAIAAGASLADSTGGGVAALIFVPVEVEVVFGVVVRLRVFLVEVGC
jgi:hypothetical protein